MTVPGPIRSAVPALLAAGLGHHQAGRLTEAYDIYRRVLAVAPQQPDALHLLGVVAYQLGQPEQAVALIRQAIDRRADNPDFYVNLGNALQALGRHPAAVNAFGRAAALERPLRAETLFNLGNALRLAERPAEAMAAQAEAARLAPGFAPAFRNLGLLLHGQGRLVEAEAALRRAAMLAPEDPEAHYALGLVLKDAGRIEPAVAALRTALARDPAHAAAHDALGSALKDLGRLEEAVAAYRAAVAQDPDFAAAHYNLAGALQDLGQPVEALDGYRRCLDLDPANDSARHMVAALRGETTAAAPAAYVREMFDGYAAGFEHHLLTRLHYRAPEWLREAVDSVRASTAATRPAAPTRPDAPVPPAAFARVLDLGCGSGLVGAAFRDLAGILDGVDLAPRMIETCRRRGIYDALQVSDVVDFLTAGGPPYDLLLAADLFIYIGDLAAVFAAVRARSAPGGLFAFSVERLDQGGGRRRRLCAAPIRPLRPVDRLHRRAGEGPRVRRRRRDGCAVARGPGSTHPRPHLRPARRLDLGF